MWSCWRNGFFRTLKVLDKNELPETKRRSGPLGNHGLHEKREAYSQSGTDGKTEHLGSSVISVKMENYELMDKMVIFEKVKKQDLMQQIVLAQKGQY
uniref:Transposase n=1 Tax=Heterorhabditis bacteriophora TaxID=37862 RepID=A0A1I7WJK8_HETBA